MFWAWFVCLLSFCPKSVQDESFILHLRFPCLLGIRVQSTSLSSYKRFEGETRLPSMRSCLPRFDRSIFISFTITSSYKKLFSIFSALPSIGVIFSPFSDCGILPTSSTHDILLDLNIMSSSACCLSRHTPSPDGVAPRPAVASPPPFKLNSKSQDLLPSSWSSGSGLSKAEDAAAIQAIFEEDKSDQGSELDKAVSKKASSTFTAVKNRLKKHLSRDSGITNSKRHSRASVGTSEEEIERRAELRRIRHKRIQEELSQEGVYDDDAKSLSTVDAPVAPNISAIQKRASWTPGDPSPLPDFALPALTPPEPPPLKLNIRPVTIFNQYVSSLIHSTSRTCQTCHTNIFQKRPYAGSTLLWFDVATNTNHESAGGSLLHRMEQYYDQLQHGPLATT